jgi:Ca2+-binding EF-hand superfamily protein
MKLKTTLACTLGLLAAGALPLSAQQPGGGGRLAEFLKRADKDGDGKISKDEFKAMSQRDESEERFARADANSDGYLDSDEMARIGERMRRGTGGPGSPGRPEGSGGFRRPPGESPEGSPRPEGERPPGPRPEGDRPAGPRPEGDRPGGPPPGGPGFNPDEVYARMDKNGDGAVDKEEYHDFARQEIEQRFGRLDENGDGKVTKDEMRAGMERLRNAMRGGPGGPPGMPGGDGMRRPGGEGGREGGFRRPPEGGSDRGGFRRPPEGEGRPQPPEGEGRPRPPLEDEAPKKDPA